MINPFSTPNRKDNNFQTVKRRLCRRLGASLTKPSNAFDNKTLYSLSDSDSDCDTLVDYELNNDVNEYSTELEGTEGDSLPFDDQSWTRQSLPEQSRLSHHGASGFRFYSRECSEARQEDLLDEEDCSWVMPRPTAKSPKAKSRFALFARRTKRTGVCMGLETQLLDPEERSWM